MGAFGEVLARYENFVEIDPEVKDAWGIPALRFSYRFGENEHKMAKDMAVAGREMFEAAKFEILSSSDEMLTEGWSIHELGTARMGDDPKTSVVNQFQQCHDVKNCWWWMAARTSMLPARIQRGRSWRCAGAHATIWPTN